MGRTTDDEGETSTTTCKSDDDRPLKKARYVWQIKGKYHLKKSEEDKTLPFLPKTKRNKECDRIVPTSCGDEEHGPDYQLLGAEKVEETQMKIEENNQISTVKEDSSASVEEKESDDMPLTTRAEFSRFLRSHVASTLMLRKWQARQVARCFVDNTINRVLEDMGFVPLPVDADDIVDDEFPMTESENDDGLEDEAVLMAIHSHGLQRSEGEPSGLSTASAQENEVKDQPTVNYFCKEINNGSSHCACSLAQRAAGAVENLDPFHQRPVCHLWDQIQLDTEKYQELESMSHELVDRGQWCSDSGMFNAFVSSESSSDSGSKCYEEDYEQNALLRTESETARIDEVTIQEQNSFPSDSFVDVDMEEEKSSSLEHSDFLDKAVAVAIQKKGLSTFSCTDYG